jgi:cytochrome P450
MDGDRTETAAAEPARPSESGAANGGDRLDVSQLRRRNLLGELALWVLSNRTILGWLRKWKPFFRLGGITYAVRAEHVREILSRDQIFNVEGDRIERANGAGHRARGSNFLLGMQAAPERKRGGCPMQAHAARQGLDAKPAADLSYYEYQTLVMRHFPLEDLAWVSSIVEREAYAAMSAVEKGSVDAIRSLIARTALAIVREYYGVPVHDREDFANVTCAISHWLFYPEVTDKFDDLGTKASARLNAQIDAAIAVAKRTSERRTIVQRLVADGAITEETARTIVFGMIMGFVSTNTMAGGHILEVLLDHPDYLEHTRAAATSARRDDERLRRCLFEAIRFKPLVREPLRLCVEPYTVGEGTRSQRRFKPKDRIITLTRSAMMDETFVKSPNDYNPDRSAHESIVFGHGLHRCIGAPIAEVHLVQTFRVLLQRANLRRARGPEGVMKNLGPFPERLIVTFDAVSGSRS